MTFPDPRARRRRRRVYVVGIRVRCGDACSYIARRQVLATDPDSAVDLAMDLERRRSAGVSALKAAAGLPAENAEHAVGILSP